MARFIAVALTLGLTLPITGQEAKVALAPPTVSLLLKDRHSHIAPSRAGCAHTGGGNVDVQQPAPDTVVVTVTGAAVAADHPCAASSAAMAFDLAQDFEVSFDKPGNSTARLSIEARVIGVLRGSRIGSASESGGCVAVTCGGGELVSVNLPSHGVSCSESLSINDRAGPGAVPVSAGPLVLRASWQVSATHPKALLGKAASAEFAPDPALDPLWIGAPKEPFHGASKKDFGLQVILRVAEDAPAEPKGGGVSVKRP